MMEQKTTQEKHDRAKYKLAASIKECMKTTPVDRITVKDIVEGSGLTRQEGCVVCHSCGYSKCS